MQNKYVGSSLNDAINDFVKNDLEAKELMKKQELINKISSNIVAIRQKNGLTQKELAEIINTKQASISRLEKGNLNKFPTIEFLNRIANGLNKKECANDEEAKHFANRMKSNGSDYPVVYFKSDTTGEKAFEEFFVPGEETDLKRFEALGVVEHSSRHSMDEVDAFFKRLEELFIDNSFTKAQVVEAIKEFIPNFEHEEKGKNLDQKM